MEIKVLREEISPDRKESLSTRVDNRILQNLLIWNREV